MDVARPGAMGFSFTRRDSDPDRARSDLAAAVEIIAAAEEVEKALDDATERLKRDFTDDALGEQQRLIDHAATIGDPALRQLYRDQWLNRFSDEIAPRRVFERKPFQRSGSFKNGRFVPPSPPVGEQARAIASSGIDGPTARALILGFANFPEELAAHCEQLAARPIADCGTAKMRDALVNAAFSGAALDREALGPI